MQMKKCFAEMVISLKMKLTGKNRIQMTQVENKFGLTYSQILATLTLAITIIAIWVTLNSRLAKVEAEVVNLKTQSANTNDYIETLRREQRENFMKLSDKMDILIETGNGYKENRH